MKRKLNLILIILILSIALSACTGRSSMTASGWAGLTADEETAYLSFSTHVIAVNLANGTERWRYPAEADPKLTFYAAPGLTEDGNLIVGGYDNVLYRLNAQNGQAAPLFDGAGGRYIGAPLVTAELIYAPSADHTLYALNMDGQKVWDFVTDEPLWAKPATDPDCNCIYLSSMDHKVYALEAETGNTVWISEDLDGAIVGTPVISSDGILYVGTFANELVALDAASGNELWRFQAQNWVWAGPALSEDSLYFGDVNGTFYALDAHTGGSQWQLQPDGAIVGKPLVTADGIYFTTEEGSLVALTPEGAIRWNQSFETNLHAGPISAGDLILIATSNPETLLIAVDSNGVQKWSFGLE